MSDRIKLNVGGKIFETTKTTLVQSTYFQTMIDRWKMEEIQFLDRSSEGFEHILNYLRNTQYVIPKQYLYEIDFYGIEYNNEPIEDETLEDISNKIDNLTAKIHYLTVKIKDLVNMTHKLNKQYKMVKRMYDNGEYSDSFSSEDSD